MSAADRIEALERAFREKSVSKHPSLLLLNANDALDFLGAGLAQGLSLAGVEGFRVTDSGAFQPLQDFSNDRAEYEGMTADFVRDTEELIKRGAGAGIHFEVVFDSG
jgi:hypothetical protein